MLFLFPMPPPFPIMVQDRPRKEEYEMTKIMGKCRLCRRERTKLFLKGLRCVSGKCPLDRKGAVPPGMHGIKSGVRLSQYGIQLREKQKVKRFYGIIETQSKKYFLIAKQKGKQGIGVAFLSLLEKRLDNVVYRLGLAPSRIAAKRLISHGHVLVNGKRTRVPSRLVKTGDVVILDTKAQGITAIQEWIEKAEIKVPDWLERKGFGGKVKKDLDEKDLPQDLNISLVTEFYSR